MARFPRIFIIAASAVVAIGGTAYVLLTPSTTADEPAQTIVVKRLTPVTTPEDLLVVSEKETEEPSEPIRLDASDDLVRAAVAELSSHPILTSWLVTDDLVRRFVASVEAIAGGYSPRESLDFLRPRQPFLVRESDGRLVIAPSSFHRYDLAVEVFASIDVNGAAAVYHRLKPTIDAAHREIAWFSDDFDGRLDEAIEHLLAVEVPAGDVAVERSILTYAFSDASLEGMTDAQRHLLRMGPRNALRIQAKLREFQRALEPPRPPVHPTST